MSEQMEFYDSCIPALPSGSYRIQVNQSVKKEDALSAQEFSASHAFRVDGAFYQMEDNELVQIFPADGSSGEYDGQIPFMVLREAAFPWNRDERDSDGNRIPWVGLLLLDREEILAQESMSLASYRKTQSGELRCRIPDRQDDITFATLTIGMELFKRLLPKAKELPYLAHVRSIVQKDQEDAQYAVLLSNRLPNGGVTGKWMNLFLVSLEGIYEQIEQNKSTSYDSVRLVILKNTTFFSKADQKGSFSHIASQINIEHTFLRFADWEKSPESVRSYLEHGYLPISSHMRTGEESFGVIRSMASCERLGERKDRRTFFSADQALVYDRDNGIFDYTYANAFETGRMLAFSDRTVLEQLGRLRVKGQALTDRILRYLKQQYASGEQIQEMLKEDFLLCNCIENIGMSGFQKIGEALPVGSLVPKPVYTWNTDDASNEEICGFWKKYGSLLKQPFMTEIGILSGWWERLLRCEPFSYQEIVYQEALLPENSIRFFYLDEMWLEACFDGLLAYGMDCGRQEPFQDFIKDMVFQEVGWNRGSILSGILLRSPLASRWPNLVIEALDIKGQKLAAKSRRQLKPDTLLVIFEEIPAKFCFKEPMEGIGMGAMEGKIRPEDFLCDRELSVLRICTDEEGKGLAECLAEEYHKTASSSAFAFGLLRRLGVVEFIGEGGNVT